MSEFAMVGWVIAGILGLGWWLTSKYDAREREIVNAINILGQKMENEVMPKLAQQHEQLRMVEQQLSQKM